MSKIGQIDAQTLGLIVDAGSPDNLMGSEWSDRVEELARAAGCPPSVVAPHHLEVGGVGNGTQVCKTRVTHPVSVPMLDATAARGQYSAAKVPNSQIPGLLGMRTLREHKMILDCGSSRLIKPGPGGIEMKLSPGSRVFPLHTAPSGHVVLPCTQHAGSTRRVNLLVWLGLLGVAILTVTETGSSASRR